MSNSSTAAPGPPAPPPPPPGLPPGSPSAWRQVSGWCSGRVDWSEGRGGGARPSRDMSTLCFRSLSSFLLLFLFFILSSIECQTNPAETSLQLPVSPHRMSLHQMSLLPSCLKYYYLCLSSSWFLKPTKFFKPTSCNFAVRIFSTMQRARESEGRRLAKKMMMPKRGFIFIFMQILLRTKTAVS